MLCRLLYLYSARNATSLFSEKSIFLNFSIVFVFGSYREKRRVNSASNSSSISPPFRLTLLYLEYNASFDSFVISDSFARANVCVSEFHPGKRRANSSFNSGSILRFLCFLYKYIPRKFSFEQFEKSFTTLFLSLSLNVWVSGSQFGKRNINSAFISCGISRLCLFL